MNRLILTLICGSFLGAMAILAGGTANADKAFYDEFVAKYVKPDSSEAKDIGFAEACNKAKCGHLPRGPEQERIRNAYGKELAKLLKRDTDKENKPKIQAALDKVAQLKASSDDSKSPTFGELIQAGKLPAGAPKTSKHRYRDRRIHKCRSTLRDKACPRFVSFALGFVAPRVDLCRRAGGGTEQALLSLD